MHNKITSAAEAVAIVQTGDAICTSGFVGIGVPDALLVALERRFVDLLASIINITGFGDDPVPKFPHHVRYHHSDESFVF
jgi:acyl CoA:acetate/3-ketoacid CoA transferase alpha subunit